MDALMGPWRELKNKRPNDSVKIGCVNYLDYEQDDIPGKRDDALSRVMIKPEAFACEQELRAVITHSLVPATKEGEDTTYSEHEVVHVNLDTLVEAVYVSPLAGEWFRDLVEDVLKHYAQAFPVKQSSLARDPMF